MFTGPGRRGAIFGYHLFDSDFVLDRPLMTDTPETSFSGQSNADIPTYGSRHTRIHFPVEEPRPPSSASGNHKRHGHGTGRLSPSRSQASSRRRVYSMEVSKPSAGNSRARRISSNPFTPQQGSSKDHISADLSASISNFSDEYDLCA